MRKPIRSANVTSLVAVLASFAVVSIVVHHVIPAAMTAPFAKFFIAAPDESAQCCVIVKDARFLMSSRGFHIGHWSFALVDILSGMQKLSRPKECKIALTDSVASRHRLNTVEIVTESSRYMHTSLMILENMLGVSFRLLSTSQRCDDNAVMINADASSNPNRWLNWTGIRAPEETSADVLECAKTPKDDLLIYNREQNRQIANVESITEFAAKLGLKVRNVFAGQLYPEGQFCEMAKERRAIVTPMGVNKIVCGSSEPELPLWLCRLKLHCLSATDFFHAKKTHGFTFGGIGLGCAKESTAARPLMHGEMMLRVTENAQQKLDAKARLQCRYQHLMMC
mmetsp:Transcript_9610/g.43603  ORF Transcript_9610/g.43603 Transcript_9610/m.43603 type:complete len:339 (-) Transcript_9610:648-1664(-)